MRRLALFLAAAVLAFGAVTFVALEGKSVAVLHTKSAGGDEHRTRVWLAEADDGSIWIEAATPARPFYEDLASSPAMEMEILGPFWARNAMLVRGRAELVPEPGGHDRIRAMLRNKYGWADEWIALLADTSDSRAIRFVADSNDAR